MEIDMKPGKYVIAVSGGVDSVVLLDLLVRQAKSQKPKAKSSSQPFSPVPNPQSSVASLQLVVAHYDHGIRQESAKDRHFVQELAGHYGLPFETAEGHLGSEAGEATARKKRYGFLRSVQKRYQANAIITAHHQDDVLETMVLNLLRGTGRRGLTSLRSTDNLLRPLLDRRKAEITAYAKQHQLRWIEDATNTDTRYLRNYVRHKLLPRLQPHQRTELLALQQNMLRTNQEINQEIATLLQSYDRVINRNWFVSLPFAIQQEAVAEILRSEHQEISQPMINKISVAAKTLPPGKKLEISGSLQLESKKHHVEFVGNQTSGIRAASSV